MSAVVIGVVGVWLLALTSTGLWAWALQRYRPRPRCGGDRQVTVTAGCEVREQPEQGWTRDAALHQGRHVPGVPRPRVLAAELPALAEAVVRARWFGQARGGGGKAAALRQQAITNRMYAESWAWFVRGTGAAVAAELLEKELVTPEAVVRLWATDLAHAERYAPKPGDVEARRGHRRNGLRWEPR